MEDYREPYAVERIDLSECHGMLFAHCRSDDGWRVVVMREAIDSAGDDQLMLLDSTEGEP